MKSKGITMVELIVSIGLISMVMLFVFGILVDVRQEEITSGVKSQDMLNRSLIIRTIQDDFINRGLYAISECPNFDLDGITCLRFHYKDGLNPTDLYVHNNSITYGREKWTLTTGNYNIATENFQYNYCYDYNELDDRFYEDETNPDKKYAMTLVFYVNLRGHALESSVLLDLELFSTGRVGDTCLPGTSNPNCTEFDTTDLSEKNSFVINSCELYRVKAQDEI